MTWSEVRTVYEMTKLEGREFTIGSTHVLTPNKLLDEVAFFDKNKEKERSEDSDGEV